jgi:hypothetical protein
MDFFIVETTEEVNGKVESKRINPIPLTNYTTE